MAHLFTGFGFIFIPLPERLSGCVKTHTTSCDDLFNRLNVGTANSGVPAKTILSLLFIAMTYFFFVLLTFF